MLDSKNQIPEVQAYCNNLQRFLDSGLVRFDRVDLLKMELARLEREIGIRPQP
ncbi:hypothetical protein FHS19_006882 [Paenibacillus rhizosphaerae]|uniref:Uncharacterized protein n=1 Tax=Paenibacillus rhizosphaerae TaxID=297318 RepID=A0A839TZ51_9BACL|nr:hypothetical protein [Paenibacillus rhizosphaerae]MBB3132155.1 hypothetical protein [Paenibacillus rhizosphaerae]